MIGRVFESCNLDQISNCTRIVLKCSIKRFASISNYGIAMVHDKRIIDVSACRFLTACACGLFLISTLLPFLAVPFYSIVEEDEYITTHWSLMATISHRVLGVEKESHVLLFSDYWLASRRLGGPPPVNLDIPWALISMFLMQILTLGFGFASVFWNVKKIRLLPLLTSLFVLSLMVFANIRAQDLTYGLTRYEPGYWFAYPSIALFLSAFVLGLKNK